MHNRLALGRFPWHCMVTYKQLPGVRMLVHWKAVTTTKTLREKKFTKLSRSFVVVAESKELLSFKNNMANSSRLALWHKTVNFYPWHRHPFHMGTGLSHRCITSDTSHWQRAWESSGRCSKCVGPWSYMGNSGVLDPWLWLGPAPVATVLLGVNQHVSVSASLFDPVSL